jgi:dTDP-4-dehydrorhamnose 3,5-epimerase
MLIRETGFIGLKVIQPDVFKDERGFFLETFQTTRYKNYGISEEFVQDNQSFSSRGVLRGLHFQLKQPQAQIVTVLSGRIFDVCVDIRKDSRTFGKWFGIELSDQGPRQIYMAPGFAHGYCVLSDHANLHYKVSSEYDSSDQSGIIWNDPDIDISWPEFEHLISPKDLGFKKFRDVI